MAGCYYYRVVVARRTMSHFFPLYSSAFCHIYSLGRRRHTAHTWYASHKRNINPGPLCCLLIKTKKSARRIPRGSSYIYIIIHANSYTHAHTCNTYARTHARVHVYGRTKNGFANNFVNAILKILRVRRVARVCHGNFLGIKRSRAGRENRTQHQQQQQYL